ncbi:MAG: 30S ribosomal protein S6 [bacterium]|nr:30S ribosomal protein S6 [bacterium]
MKKYELLLVLPGTLDEKEAEIKSGEILELVKTTATETALRVLGKNRLAYPIKQIRYGYFYTVAFQAEPAGLKILQDKLALMRDLLRAIISAYNPKWSVNQKINYAATDAGMSTLVHEETQEVARREVVRAKPTPAPAIVKAKAEDKPVDLEDIDKKLNEILDGSVLINP